MAFFQSAITTLQTLVVALGAGAVYALEGSIKEVSKNIFIIT